MQAEIRDDIKNTSVGNEAERILRSCVHCGFCTATCPTYRLLGDELDGPRGRIYLIKSLLEGNPATDTTRDHLDRCLTCRACETTCPSGVEYGKLLDIGRHVIEEETRRPLFDRMFRRVLLMTLPYRQRFAFLLTLGRTFRPLLPRKLSQLIPHKQQALQPVINEAHKNKVILLAGCVQPSLAPRINQAVKQLLSMSGVSVIEPEGEQCCGALSQHLNDGDQASDFMRANIDTLYPLLDEDVEAIISTASGCGVHIKDYVYYFRDDPAYYEKARKVSALTKDIAEYLQGKDTSQLKPVKTGARVAFQSPCTLQHGQKLNGVVESLLSKLGCKLVPVDNAFLCCGSAGVYSLLQPEISQQLKQNKLDTLLQNDAEVILTANIGCLEHLRKSSPVPVRHWAEYIVGLLRE